MCNESQTIAGGSGVEMYNNTIVNMLLLIGINIFFFIIINNKLWKQKSNIIWWL